MKTKRISSKIKKYDSNFWKNKKILVTGGQGFVGSHVVENLINKRKVDKSQIIIPNRKKIDLRNFRDTLKLTKGIDIILHLAADVGGIAYSSAYPATQMKNCLLIDLNVFEAAFQNNVKKLVCVSSAVAYPINVRSPLKEENIFLGEPAKNGYGYGFAKRMNVVMARAYSQEKKLNACVLIAANSYGPRQDFDLKSGHVIPALIKKSFTQKKLEVWGDGTQVRDFFYVKDFAESIVLAAERLKTYEPINIGTGKGESIKNLVNLIVRLTNFKGEIYYDASKPQGQKIRIVNIEKAKKLLKFKPEYILEMGIKETIEWYLKNERKRTSKNT